MEKPQYCPLKAIKGHKYYEEITTKMLDGYSISRV